MKNYCRVDELAESLDCLSRIASDASNWDVVGASPTPTAIKEIL